jgi:hypothetical protein
MSLLEKDSPNNKLITSGNEAQKCLQKFSFLDVSSRSRFWPKRSTIRCRLFGGWLKNLVKHFFLDFMASLKRIRNVFFRERKLRFCSIEFCNKL